MGTCKIKRNVMGGRQTEYGTSQNGRVCYSGGEKLQEGVRMVGYGGAGRRAGCIGVIPTSNFSSFPPSLVSSYLKGGSHHHSAYTPCSWGRAGGCKGRYSQSDIHFPPFYLSHGTARVCCVCRVLLA